MLTCGHIAYDTKEACFLLQASSFGDGSGFHVSDFVIFGILVFITKNFS